jgi:glutathione S-transferase
MKYLSVAEARPMSGLRLALTVQTPGPWGLVARALFDIRKVPYVPVRQDVGAANEELVAWTGRRNAPVAVYNDEPAVDGWLEIVNLAERLGSGPSLTPDDPVERALAAGFSAEICGHNGFGWARRLNMRPPGAAPAKPQAPDPQSPQAQMMRAYGMHDGAAEAADARIAGILKALSAQLHRQREAGSAYLVGDRLSSCDVHWACFSILVAPLPPQDCFAAEQILEMFSNKSEAVAAALDPILIEHRDHVWREHIGLPIDYLPD